MEEVGGWKRRGGEGEGLGGEGREKGGRREGGCCVYALGGIDAAEPVYTHGTYSVCTHAGYL
jgi:hypothetical protein